MNRLKVERRRRRTPNYTPLMPLRRRRWLVVWGMLGVILALLLAAVVATFISGRRADSEARHNLLVRTAGAAAALDPDLVARLTGTADDESQPYFALIRERLASIHTTAQDTRFVYLLGLRDGNVVFLADAEPEDSSDYSPPGQVYEQATEALRSLFDSGEAFVEGPLTDDWGTWVSGLVPIRDQATGKVLAVLGMDIDASAWPRQLGPYQLPTLTLAIVSVVIVLAFILFQQRQDEAQLRHLATRDFLTGIPNRFVLEESLRRAVGRAKQGRPSALLFLDVDNFKLVNDTFTHAAGDRLLNSLTGLLQRNLRDGDLLARLGGDEFAVLLDQADLARAQVVAERLRIAVGEHRFIIGQQNVDLSLSVGLATIDGEMEAERILSTADIALHTAKERGRNRVVSLGPDDQATRELSEAGRLLSLIKAALDDGSFVLHYQPVVQLENGRVGYYEGLVRLKDVNGGVVAPGVFIPVAERFGLMSQVDRWVTRKAIEVLESHADVGLFINLSATSLADEDFLAFIEAAVREHPAVIGRLGFEITETAAIRDFARTEQWIRKLLELGCKFALDDFGSGFSSFSYLRRLPVDFVKIDGSFVRNMDAEPTHRAFVQAINTVVHTLGKKTVAEFVENEAVLELLKGLEVDYAQGYHLGRPEACRADEGSASQPSSPTQPSTRADKKEAASAG